MERKTYYVSVQSKTVMENQGDAAYEMEINATEEDLLRLEELFEEEEDYELGTYVRAHNPTVPYHHDRENDGYDAVLKEVYRTLHELGTAQTKKHIEGMGIL